MAETWTRNYTDLNTGVTYSCTFRPYIEKTITQETSSTIKLKFDAKLQMTVNRSTTNDARMMLASGLNVQHSFSSGSVTIASSDIPTTTTPKTKNIISKTITYNKTSNTQTFQQTIILEYNFLGRIETTAKQTFSYTIPIDSKYTYNISAIRVASDGATTPDGDGEWIFIQSTISTDNNTSDNPINSSTFKYDDVAESITWYEDNSKTSAVTFPWVMPSGQNSITWYAWYHSDQVSHKLSIQLTNSFGAGSVMSIFIKPVYKTINIKPGGTGIAFGGNSIEDDFSCYMPMTIRANNSVAVVTDNDSTTHPSSALYPKLIELQDTNGLPIGYVEGTLSTDGKNGVSLTAKKMVSDTAKYNYLRLLVDDSGDPVVQVGNAAAWREGLGLGSLATKSSVAPTTLAKTFSKVHSSAQASGNVFTVSITCKADAGYKPIAVTGVYCNGTGTGAVYLRGFNVNGYNAGPTEFTVDTYWRASGSVSANAMTAYVEILTMKTSLS